MAVSARIRYPNTFYGAIASSPALNSFGPLSSNRYKFESAKWASEVYEEYGNAASKIKTSMLAFKKCIAGRRKLALVVNPHFSKLTDEKDNTCDTTIPDLDVCKNSTSLGYERLYNAALNTYLAISKYNYPWIEKYPTADPFSDLIDKTIQAKTAGEVLRIPLLATSWANESACINAFNGNISRASNGNLASNQPAFGYIVCDYYPINDRSIPADNVLPETYARGNVDICTNPDWKAVDYGRENEYFLQKYAMTNDFLDTTDKLLIVQGSYDRTAAIGSPILTVTEMLNHSRVILVNGAAHAEDSVSEAVEPRGLKPQLDQVSWIPFPHIM